MTETTKPVACIAILPVTHQSHALPLSAAGLVVRYAASACEAPNPICSVNARRRVGCRKTRCLQKSSSGMFQPQTMLIRPSHNRFAITKGQARTWSAGSRGVPGGYCPRFDSFADH